MCKNVYFVARFRLYNGDNELVYANADEQLGADVKEARAEYERRCDAKENTWKSENGYHSNYYLIQIEEIEENGKNTIYNNCLDCQYLD